MDTKTPSSRIFVDGIPEKVTAREQYWYDLYIAAEPETHFQQASGSIQIDVPYDGYRCLSKQAVQNLLDQPEAMKSGAAGYIGNLVIGPNFDWGNDWSRMPDPTIVPVEIPLQAGFMQHQQWGADRWRAIIQRDYQPEDIHFPPIKLDIQVYDDVASSTQRSFEDFIRQRLHENQLDGEVDIGFLVCVPLPRVIENDRITVSVKSFEVQWPTFAAPWQMRWYVETGNEKIIETPVDWKFDPSRNTIQIRDIQTQVEIEDTEEYLSPLTNHRCRLRLRMKLPGLFLPERDGHTAGQVNSELKGSLSISIDNLLLSGREVAWIGADGFVTRGDLPVIKHITEINASYSALLNELFTKRTISTFRQWVFPGVKLTEARASDIAAALNDLGYRTTIEKLKYDSDEKELLESISLRCYKIGGLPDRTQAPIWMEVRLQRIAKSKTTQERQLKGLVLSTEWNTSDLLLQMRASMRTASDILDVDTASLMDTLNKRFASVMDVR